MPRSPALESVDELRATMVAIAEATSAGLEVEAGLTGRRDALLSDLAVLAATGALFTPVVDLNSSQIQLITTCSTSLATVAAHAQARASQSVSEAADGTASVSIDSGETSFLPGLAADLEGLIQTGASEMAAASARVTALLEAVSDFGLGHYLGCWRATAGLLRARAHTHTHTPHFLAPNGG